MLGPEFVKQYALLNREHHNGKHIWELCQMSFCAAGIERGDAADGNVRQLAEACIPRLDTDTIYLRRDAFIGWLVFLKVPEHLLADDAGVLAESHMGVRNLLSYSHFAIVGKRFRQRLLRDRYELASLLVGWAKSQTSTRRASEELTELVGQYVSLRDDLRRLQRAAAKVLRHPEIPLRLYRYASVIAGRDWLNVHH